MIFVGVDWAEEHHDVCVVDAEGRTLGRARVDEGMSGTSRLHALLAEHASEPTEVVVGIETDRGLLVGSLLAAGYQVYAINPLSVARYRERHSVSGAKSDKGDALVLAELVRLDRHNHRQMAGDSDLAEAVKILARNHQNLIWTRQRQTNRLRSTLREFYPAALRLFAGELDSPAALATLSLAATPAEGRALSRSKLAAALRRAGRQRGVEQAAAEIQQQLRAPELEAPALVAQADAAVVRATVAVLLTLNTQIAALEAELSASFRAHPDAEIITSLPGLGTILGARVLGEFGDDRTRFADCKARRNYAGMAPITKASGTKTTVIARIARNKRLGDALYLWAFCSLTSSPGARSYYDRHRARGATHHQAVRCLGNRLVGIMHGCLRYRQNYSEEIAWPSTEALAA